MIDARGSSEKWFDIHARLLEAPFKPLSSLIGSSVSDMLKESQNLQLLVRRATSLHDSLEMPLGIHPPDLALEIHISQ